MDEVASLVIRVLSENVETAERRLRELEEQSRRTERETRRLGAVDFRQVAVGLAAYGLGVAGIAVQVKNAVDRWLEYDKAIKQVNSIAGLTEARFKSLRKETLLLASSLGVDATEAAKGLFDVFQADIPEASALKFLEAATKLAIGGGTTTSTAVNAITNVMKAYNLEANRATEISDKLFTTVLYGKASFDGLAGALAGATVPGAALGVKFEEILAMVTTITAQGTSTSEAITQIERSIQALLNPSDEMLVVFQNLKVASGRQMIANYGLVGSLQKVQELYLGNDMAMVKALGSVVAFAAATGTTGDKLDDSARSMDQVTNAAGRTEKAFATNADTVQNSLEAVRASSVLLVEQMEGSLGVIKAFSDALVGAAGLIAQLSGASGTSLQNALSNNGPMGNALKIEEQIRLQIKIQGLKKQLDETNASPLKYHPFKAAGAAVDLLQLNNAVKDLKQLNAAMDAMPASEKNAGAVFYKLTQAQENLKKASDPNIIAAYNAKIKDLTGDFKELTTATAGAAAADSVFADIEKEQAATSKKTQEDRAKAVLAGLELEEKRRKVLIDAGAEAKNLATSEIEKLQQKQALIRDAMNSTDSKAKLDKLVGDKAIANLDEQIKLIREREAEKGSGGGGKGTDNPLSLDSLPELNDPFSPRNAFDQLIKEEEEIAKSYARRREAILTETRLTEDQRLSLLNDASEKYRVIMARADEQRMTNSLKLASDTFGQLNAIAGLFGKKGAAMAKGFAVMQATIDMVAAAQAAYKSTVGIPVVGPYLAPVAAAGALAVGAANVAKIKSTEYSGEFEHGGMIPAGKFGLVGEAGPELVRGPTVVTSARTTAQSPTAPLNATKTTVTVHNYAGGEVEEKRTKTSDGELVDIFIRRAKKEVADDIRKGGTALASAVEQSYGLRRKGR